MTNDEFIDLLIQRQFIPAAVARQLRAKAEQGDARITPQSILKYLVKKELVTRVQARQLLETTLVVSDKAESSILGLVPLMDVDMAPAAKTSRPPTKEPPPPRPDPDEPVTPKSTRPVTSDEIFFAAPNVEPNFVLPISDHDDAQSVAELVEPKSATGLKLGKPGKKSKKKTKKPVKKTAQSQGKNEWDSPLLLLGGGAVALLVVGSLVLWWLMFRETADAVLKGAHDDFDRGAYQQAADKYKYFVESYSSHQDYSDAKVRLQMTGLWEAVEGRKDFSGAAKMLPGVVAEIENEPAFIADADAPDGLSETKQQLATIVSRVAKGLADQADSAKDEQLAGQKLAELSTVLELAGNAKYVPERLRQNGDLESAREIFELVKTRQQRQAELTAALAQMDEAIARGEPAAATAVRAKLLVNYPMLLDDLALSAKVVEISAAEKAAVKFVKDAKPAAGPPPASPIVAELALAERRGDATATGDAAADVVSVDGALFALNESNGALQWRRYLGGETASLPTLLADGRVVAVDARAGELVCLARETGVLVWRQPLAGRLATPIVLGERLLVASDAGRLFVVNAATGALEGAVQFSQPIRIAPAVNEQGTRLYVVGDHSNLYTLSTSDWTCVGVVYVGHAAGGIAAPPVAVLNKVVVADNTGAATCSLRVFGVDQQGAAATEVASQRLEGLVVTPLSVDKRRVAAVTSLGQAAVVEVGAGADATALTLVAGRPPQGGEQLARFALLHNGHLWIAGRELTKLAVLPTGNQLQIRSLPRDYQGDAFDYPLQVVGTSLVHVRRPAGQGGAIVAAVDENTGSGTWETELAVPPAGAPAVDAASARIVTGAASGAVYLLDRDALARRVQDRAARLNIIGGKPPTFTASLDLGQGRLALGAIGSPTVLHFRPGDPRQPLTAVELPGPLSCPPVAWRGGFVAAADVGQVALYNSDTAAPVAAPFQPELTPDKMFHWLRPTVVGEGAAARLAVSDGVEKVYLLELAEQPQPNLKAVAAIAVGPSPLASPLAVLGSSVVAGTESGQLARFAAADLAATEPVDLGGRIAWGPHAADDGLLIGLDTGELALIAVDGSIRWRRPSEHGEPTGVPLVADGQALLLHANGGLARVALGDGAEGTFVELGQPVVAGPVAFGPRLVLAAADGTLLVVNRP